MAVSKLKKTLTYQLNNATLKRIFYKSAKEATLCGWSHCNPRWRFFDDMTHPVTAMAGNSLLFLVEGCRLKRTT